MKIIATIEARMTSKRLPGKVLLPAAGKPMLEHLVERLRRVSSIHEIVLATTTNADDDVLEKFASRLGIFCYRGSEDDVMSRVIGAAASRGAEVVVEITGDCPIIDPAVVEDVIQFFKTKKCDYVYNGLVPSFPIGMDTQVFRLETLQRSYQMTEHPLDREHVTRHIRQHPELFACLNYPAPPGLAWPELHLTLDEKADYELLRNIVEYFAEAKKSDFGLADIIRLLREDRPDWIGLNSQVKRKGLNS